MHDNELWQVYSNNGMSIPGKGGVAKDFQDDPTLIMGNSHIWFWKRDNDDVEVLLQKRALTKARRPGMYHISAGGHINIGETSVDAAVRETAEEMGINLDPSQLHYVMSTRIIGTSPNDIVNVFLYELGGEEKFTHVDGEVDSYEWWKFDDFKTIVKNANEHNLVDQGLLYFNSIIVALEYITTGKKTLL